MIDPSKFLSGIPQALREPLLKSYEEITTNYAEHRWEPAELNGGKFSEVIYSIVLGSLSGSFPAKPSKPPDMVAACRSLEQIPPNPSRIGDRSLRILIPRTLQFLYEIRNNRGVGHIGGDVDPNYLDATAVYSMSSWVLAEIVRIFHAIPTKEAQETVDAIIERKLPLIWEFDGNRRVLDPSMEKSNQALLLLHSKPGWVSEKDLFAWVDYSNTTVFQKTILKPFHKARLIEYDRAGRRVRISPLGVDTVERQILKTRN
jgi:hypothetical protein